MKKTGMILLGGVLGLLAWNTRAEGDVFASAPAFAAFEQDLLQDVIPAIESRYSVLLRPKTLPRMKT